MKEIKKKNTAASLILLTVVVAFIAAVAFDRIHMPKFKQEFVKIEKERVAVSNKLVTATIVQERLNHVRELIFNNMDFPGQPDTVDHETQFFQFITTCVSDLKLKLVSVKPITPVTNGRVTTFGYDVEIEGDFFRFGELCAKFENNRRIVTIESFDVDLIGERDVGKTRGRNNHSTENKDIRVKMRINTYRVQKG
ncbi:MAG: type 4a pilus biogenesis protein PilO [Chitinispirillales bacterium]|jgi:Tfp pilus assembly protein PilO|nr:type 4a pilus biogenesis protein PilO [Chitinispirillales bacterium]